MAKKRVYEFAKEIGIESKEVVGMLADMGVSGKTSSSSIDDGQQEALRAKIGEKKAPAVADAATQGAQPARGAAEPQGSKAEKPAKGAVEPQGSKSAQPAKAQAGSRPAKGADKAQGAKDAAGQQPARAAAGGDAAGQPQAEERKGAAAEDKGMSNEKKPAEERRQGQGQGSQGQPRQAQARQGQASQGQGGQASQGQAKPVQGQPQARQGQGQGAQGQTRQGAQGQAKQGQAQGGQAQGQARQGAQGQTRQGHGQDPARPRKKSSITAVYNAQYSKQGQGGGGRGQDPRRNRPQGARGERPARQSVDVRKAFDLAINPDAVRAEEEARRRAEEARRDREAEKKQRGEAQSKASPAPARQQEPPRVPNIYENVYQSAYDRGEDVKSLSNDRYGRGQGGSYSRGQGSGYGRGQGSGYGRGDQRYGDRGGRPDGGQRTYAGARLGQNGGQGDRGSARGGAYRGGQFGRPDDRFQRSTAGVAADDSRGKDSRDRDKDRNRNGRQRGEHDALGGRRQERLVNLEKGSGKKKQAQQPPQQQTARQEEAIRTLVLPEKLTIRELAEKIKVQPAVIVKKLFMKGTMATVNQEVDYDTAEEIALEFNCICEPEEKVDVIAELLKEEDDPEETLVARPPVVCVMGHVDHGKTSLLDAIRETRVTDKEAGGITQHIGASVVSINGKKITFLDTPGHEAFTAMRMRGANSTDIAVLVVAADDGVMPQTVEAINHAKAAGVEIIVAINKIDKPSANIERVKQELSEYELIPEDWGGSTIFCPVSAHTKEGIENLLEMIQLTAEVLELKANPNRNARGLVIEAQLDKGRGAVATVLVQKGTLKVGQPVACGSCYGKVRAMIDDQGRRVKEAGPSMPVEILGLSSVPEAGETFVCTGSEKEARSFAETYISESKNRLIEETKSKMSLDDLFSQIQSGSVKELDVIVKADVQGSVEAVRQSLEKLSNDEVVVKVIHGGVGAINESDVSLASASNAIIIGFNVRPDPTAKASAEKENVDVRLYKVIYNAIEDVEAAMKGMLDPIFEEQVTGHAEVRQIFKASGVGNIAGCYVQDGVFQRSSRVRVLRGEEKLFEGELASLKRFKDDVKEVRAGFECGLVFDGFHDFEELDVVEAFEMVEVPRT